MTIQAKGTSFAGAAVFDLPYMQLVDYRSQRPVADSILIEAVPVDDKPEEPTETVSNELFNKLTSSEQVIVQGIVDGLSDKQIATVLDKSSDTVRVQVRSVLRKLELSNRTQIASAAISYGGYSPHMPFAANQAYRVRCAAVFSRLSSSERIVVQGIVDGLTDSQIGTKLGKCKDTINARVRSILSNLELSKRPQIAFAAISYGEYSTHMPFRGTQSGRADVLKNLPASERLVVQGIVDGLSDKQIAMRLGKTSGTVRVQLQSVLRKLRLNCRAELAIAAISYGRYKTQLSAFDGT